MTKLRTTCERDRRATARFSVCRTSFAAGLRAELPDSLTSQAITAPPAYIFWRQPKVTKGSQGIAKAAAAAFAPATTP